MLRWQGAHIPLCMLAHPATILPGFRHPTPVRVRATVAGSADPGSCVAATWIGGHAPRVQCPGVGELSISVNREASFLNSRLVRGACFSASLLLAGCTAATVDTQTSLERRAGVSPSPLVASAPQSPRLPVASKGDRASRLTGWFRPAAEPNYNRTGMASWYGAKFHGRRTANGEVFDRTALTAAHPTLPLPSYVRVTNLANDRSLIVRVNDRGPFARQRLIDVSERTASLLDFKRRGKAEVRVEYVGPAASDGNDEAYLLASYQGPGDPLSVGGVVVATAPDRAGQEGIVAPPPPLLLASAGDTGARDAVARTPPAPAAFAEEPPAAAVVPGASEAVQVLTTSYGADDRIFMAFESASTLDESRN